MTNDGALAEQAALAFLQRKGLKLVLRNYQCRFGEIDLIMQDGACLVFVEVRLRRNAQFGGAAASISPHKQQRLIRSAQSYLATLKRIPACRFDAVLLEDLQTLQWLQNVIEV